MGFPGEESRTTREITLANSHGLNGLPVLNSAWSTHKPDRLNRLRKKSIPISLWKRWRFSLNEFVALTAGGQPRVAVPHDFFRSL
jgi:hypothetical protein